MFGKKEEQKIVKQSAEEYRGALSEKYKIYGREIKSDIAREPFDTVSSVRVGKSTFIVGETYKERERKTNEVSLKKGFDGKDLFSHMENEKIMFCMRAEDGKVAGEPLVIQALSRESCNGLVTSEEGMFEEKEPASTQLSMFFISSKSGNTLYKEGIFSKSCEGYLDTRKINEWGETLVEQDFAEKMGECWQIVKEDWHKIDFGKIDPLFYNGRKKLREKGNEVAKAACLFDRFVALSSKMSLSCEKIIDDDVRRYADVRKFYKLRDKVREKRQAIAEKNKERARKEKAKQEMLYQKKSDFTK